MMDLAPHHENTPLVTQTQLVQALAAMHVALWELADSPDFPYGTQTVAHPSGGFVTEGGYEQVDSVWHGQFDGQPARVTASRWRLQAPDVVDAKVRREEQSESPPSWGGDYTVHVAREPSDEATTPAARSEDEPSQVMEYLAGLLASPPATERQEVFFRADLATKGSDVNKRNHMAIMRATQLVDKDGALQNATMEVRLQEHFVLRATMVPAAAGSLVVAKFNFTLTDTGIPPKPPISVNNLDSGLFTVQNLSQATRIAGRIMGRARRIVQRPPDKSTSLVAETIER